MTLEAEFKLFIQYWQKITWELNLSSLHNIDRKSHKMSNILWVVKYILCKM